MSVLYAFPFTTTYTRNSDKVFRSALKSVLLISFAVFSFISSNAQEANKKSPAGDKGIEYKVFPNVTGGFTYQVNNGDQVIFTEQLAPVSEVPNENKQAAEKLAKLALQIYKANPTYSSREIKSEMIYLQNKEVRGTSSERTENVEAVCTFSGTLESGDPTVTGRIFRDAIASTCASPKACPGTFGSASFFYDTHTVTNPTASTACVTVSALSTNGQQVHVTAYTNSFNPTNICTNYLADQGSSSIATPVNFSFNIPAGGTVVLVIYNPINGSLSTPYNITVDNCPTLPCQPIVITSQPQDVTACELTNATFTVGAGPAGISYNWQEDRGSGFVYLANGGIYSGVNSATLTLTGVTPAMSGWRYRAVITCSGGGLPQISDDATLTVLPAPTQPVIIPNTSQICPGGVQQLSLVGNSVAFSYSGASISIPNSGTATPYPATLSVSGLPVNATVTSVVIQGLTHTFPADIDVVLQSPTGVNVILFSDVGGGTDVSNLTFTLSDGAAAGLPATLVAGTFRPTNSGTPDNFPAPGPGSLTQANPTLSSFIGDPNGTWNLYVVDDVGGDLGTLTGFTINFGTPASGVWSPQTGLFLDAGLTTPYTGQSVSTVYASPAATTTYTAVTNNGSCNSGQASATVTVNAPPSITAQPSTNGNTCEGDNKTFSVTATGTNITYQWQVNSGSGFVNLTNTPPYSGVTTNTLTITGSPTSINGFSYRVVVSGTCPPAANSNAVTLTVNPNPIITVGPQNQCAPVTLTASGANTYTWSPAGGLSGTTGATVTANPSATTTYTVTGTVTATGCTNIANVTVIGTPLTPAVNPANATICLGGSQLLQVSPTVTLSNTGTITIPSSGNGSPYPSTINVSGLATSGVTVASVTLNNVNHTWSDDIDVVLQSPTGVNVILMSDVGGSNNLAPGRTYTFADTGPLMTTALNPTGTYRPTNLGATDNFPAPGPGSLTQAAPAISNFGSANFNGTWRLFVVDDVGGDQGSISGWSITFNTGAVPVVFSPTTGLFTNSGLTTPYTGNPVTQVYASPTTTTTYTVTGNNTSNGNASFSSKGPVIIPGVGTGVSTGGAATAYPATVSVNGIPATATVRSVTLNGLNHTWADDVDIVLQSPTGVNVILVSDAGGSGDYINHTYTLTDTASAALLDGTVAPSGTYRPTNFEAAADNFPAPGPGAITQPSPALASFTGNPNGVWRLFAVDDLGGDVGNLGSVTITFDVPVVTCTSPPTSVTITVHQPVVYTAHPQNRTVCAGDNTTFTYTATGTVQTIQWQVNTGSGFVNIANNATYSGATTNTLTVSGITQAMNNYRYRVVLTSAGCGPQPSNEATLTVNPKPVATLSATLTELRPGLTSTLSVTSTTPPVGYIWYLNGVAIQGATNATHIVDAFNLGTYTVRVVDANGCADTSNAITITALATSNLFIFPNPTSTGMFTVTYYTPNFNTPVTINLIDMKGRRIESRVAQTNAPYTRFDFSTSKLSTGVYVIEFRNGLGDRLAAGRVVVID